MKRIAFGLGGIIAAGIAYQWFGSRRDRKRYPPPGRLVDVGTSMLHLHEQGTGRPGVLLEAGIAATSIGWALVQPEIAKFTTVCSYDRAGLGWSSKLHRQTSVAQMTGQLRRLLQASGIEPPFILVGHSFGGLIVRAFAHLYPEWVCGLILLDPVSLNSWSNCTPGDRNRLALGVRLSRRGAILAQLGLVRFALALLMAGHRGVSKRIGRTAAGKGIVALERLVGEVRKLPTDVWPVIRSHWSNPKSFLGMAAHLECLPRAAAEGLKTKLPPGIPVLVLSAGNATPDELVERETMIEGNPHGRHIVLEGAGHWLQLERPEIVVSAVRDLVQSAANPGNPG